ncbi:MAG: hypothetical protein RIB59_07755 [Rhodospirillales bacterium]
MIDLSLRDRTYWATQYPYPSPDYSFLVGGGKLIPVERAEDVPDLEGRVPVIACGSNRAPERLAQKYGDDPEPLPVIRMALADFDSVYAPHFAHYGAIPATLHPAPGTTVSLSVTWLSEGQLRRMHATERENYHFVRLNHLSLTPEFGAPMTQAFAYVSRAGAWTGASGNAIPLAAVTAAGRKAKALHQIEALEAARDKIEPGRDLETFFTAHIENAALRRARIEALCAETEAFAYAFAEIVEMD